MRKLTIAFIHNFSKLPTRLQFTPVFLLHFIHLNISGRLYLTICQFFRKIVIAMLLPSIIRQKMQEKSGVDVRQVKGIESLSECIANKTGGVSLGYTTLRRLFGLINDEREPRPNTLDIIAHFLDYSDWNSMVSELCPSDSHFMVEGESMSVSCLENGKNVEVKYYPDRVLQLVSLGDKRYEVVESANSKLRKGDIVLIDEILLHYPLHVRSVIRDGVEMGRFVAGEQHGISSISIR